MTAGPFGSPNLPRRLPGEDLRLWCLEPRGKPFEHRPAADRLKIVWEETWVELPSFRRLREAILTDIEVGRTLTPGRGALVVGAACAGTSSFLRRFAQECRQGTNKQIALAAMPDTVELRDVLVEFRKAIGRGTNPKEPVHVLEHNFYEELKHSGVIAIAVDAMEHLLHVAPRRREIMLRMLRHIGARGKFHLLLATPPELLNEADKLYNGDIPAASQPDFIGLSRPFQQYTFGEMTINDEYVNVLNVWERSLPLLNASDLAGRELALNLFALCDGVYGRLTAVLRAAAAEAITGGQERITIQLLDDLGLRPQTTFSGFRF